MADTATVSLILRFACAACTTRLQIPVATAHRKQRNCPKCRSDVRLPHLDEEVAGWREVVDTRPESSSEAECPVCARRLRVTADDIDSVRKCPICLTELVFGMQSRQQETSPPPVREPVPVVDESEIFSAVDGTENGHSAAYAVPPILPEEPTTNGRAAVDIPFREFSEVETDDDEDESDTVMPPLIVDDEHTHLPHRKQRRGGRTSIQSAKLLFWIVFLLLQFGPVTAGNLLNNDSLLLYGGFWMLFGWWFSRRISWFIVSLLVAYLRCPGCQMDIAAVSRWSCSCGFNDHRERHFLRFRCPMCQSKFGHTNCPRCQATIIIRK